MSLAHAKGERKLYLERVDSYASDDFEGGVDHFSIDCMELLQLPSFGGSSQPAETFYLRKMSATPAGVFDEVEQTGVTYLYSQLHGKTNSNHIASILDDTIEKKKKSGVDNRKLRVNWDNCSVNKCYLLARFGIEQIRLGRYDSVEFDFMEAGHTKFSPDRMFGWLSGVLKVVDIFELSDAVSAVDRARLLYARAHKKECPYSLILVDSFDENGNSEFFYDWITYFGKSFKSFGFLTSLHRLKFFQSGLSNELKAKEHTSDKSWKAIKFYKPSKIINKNIYSLKKVPMKPAKVADIKKMTKFVPSGFLSYATED